MSGPACRSCDTANEADARFCEGCGAALNRSCSGCGAPASSSARFCRSCGAVLDVPSNPAPAPAPTRKTVTVLFADLAGSTTFEEQVDPETARAVVGDYHRLLRRVAERHHAGSMKFIGDGFMAVWGVPEVGPEDADHAVAAAVDVQDCFVALAARVGEAHRTALALRVSVNTGEVVVGAGDADLVGDALNVGARLESECPHGEVVVGEETWRATRGHHRYEPLGQVQVKGRAAPVRAYQWIDRRPEPADSGPFVGRGEEFRRLNAVIDDAVAHRAARLVTIIGDPGVGKTRLAAEFAAHRGVPLIDIRCAIEGSVALAPLVDMIRTRNLDVDIPPDVAERDRILLGINNIDTGAAASVEETFWALRRYIEVLSAGEPLIVVVDDIQWADPQLLDFLEHLAEWVRDDPVVVIALARPEIRQGGTEFAVAGGWVADAIRLGGLDPDSTVGLAVQVLGGERLPAEITARLPDSTDGNPLFVRELISMLVHDGVLISQPDGWRLTIDADAIAVPPTIQALLASRLERMNHSDRRVLELASVIGNDFSTCAVGALGGLDVTATRPALHRLRRLELAQPSGAYVGDDPIWRFHHVLIRDVAYRRLLKSDRAELHERFADWVDGGGSSGAVDPEQLAARHVEAAHGYRCDLGLRDERTATLALRSARGYLAAARRALDRDALVSAGAQAARGAALATADPGLYAELLQVACEAFLAAGDVAAGTPFVDSLDTTAGSAAHANLAPWAACYRCQLLVHTDPSRLREVDERLGAVVEEFARRADATGSAKAYRVRASARARMGRIGDAELDLFEALIAARRAGDHRQITAVLGAAPNAALWGPSPVPKAGGRCLDVVRMQRMTTGAPSLEATSLRCLAVLEALRGRPEKARTMLAEARTILGDLGLRHGLMETELHAGIVELMVDDPVAAEPYFRRALDGLDVLGVGADAGQAAALLARSLLAQDRVEEADRYATESRRMAGHNLKTAIAWRAVRAEIMASQGRHADAVSLATEAVAAAADTDLILDHAEACLTLSRVLAAAGDPVGAARARADAQTLYAAKDAVFRGEISPSVSDAAPISGAVASGRLKLSNRATEVVAAVDRALRGSAPDTLFAIDADAFVYEDRRSIKGAPIAGSAAFVAAAKRKSDQYPHFESRTLAVRGDSLALLSLRWWDDTGNEAVSLDVIELGADDMMRYHGRFDEDDFAGAYAELDRRYYAGEGAPFAVNGVTVTQFVQAMSARDVQAARRLSDPAFRWKADPAALKPAERTVDEFFAWLAERDRQVSALRFWLQAIKWVSAECFVARAEIKATGTDGQEYRWEHIFVEEYRNGLASSNREFTVDQEDAAFAYAESLARPALDPLALRNRCTASAMAGVVSEILAVRGDRLALGRHLMADEEGNETTSLLLREIDTEGLTVFECRYDEVDFSTAFRELEHRYYAGEGAEFAANGNVSAQVSEALNLGDMDTVRALCAPDYRWRAPDSALKPTERSLDEMAEWGRARSRMIDTQRSWIAAVHWVSPHCAVGLVRIEAAGPDGESYHWSVPFVSAFRDGLLTSSIEFADTAEAVSYATHRALAAECRLAVRNAASESALTFHHAMQSRDLDRACALFADTCTLENRQSITGEPIRGSGPLREALSRSLQEFNHFEADILAVRGERLTLTRSVWSDDAGNATSHCSVAEIDGAALSVANIRFDLEDFDPAYRALERRYYSAEGESFAINGRAIGGFMEALDDLDVEAARPLCSPDFVWICPPSTFTAERRCLEEFFAWQREHAAQATSVKHYLPAINWHSPNCLVARGAVVGVNPDGQNFAWSALYVAEFRAGLVASVRQFDPDDEAGAFAYAESLASQDGDQLAVHNTAGDAAQTFSRTLQNHDMAAAARLFTDTCIFDDQRLLSGDPIRGRESLRTALHRILQQFSHFETDILAVRGDRLALSHVHWGDDAGNTTSYYDVVEVNENSDTVRNVRFDADNFDGAFVELETRFYAGEGGAFAANGVVAVSFLEAVDKVDLDAARTLSTDDFTWFASPTTSVGVERNLEQFFGWLDERAKHLPAVKYYAAGIRWTSPDCFIAQIRVGAISFHSEQPALAASAVGEFRAGLLASIREFDDEEAARAYATERSGAVTDHLSVSNNATAASVKITRALKNRDLDSAVELFDAGWRWEDHRGLGGGTIRGNAQVRSALAQVLLQFNGFESTPLAVRGRRLALLRIRWTDDQGNQSEFLHIVEADENVRFVGTARFDADDFLAAYEELERRFYAGEGAAYAALASMTAESTRALNKGDFQHLFDDFYSPEVFVENHSCSGFPNRSAAEFKESLIDLHRMLSEVRWWQSAVRWLSPSVCVARLERTGIGRDGEDYAWARILVTRIQAYRVTEFHDFDADDSVAALNYAQQCLLTDRGSPPPTDPGR